MKAAGLASQARPPNLTQPRENFSDLSEPVANGQPEIPQFRHVENNGSENLSVGLITCVFRPTALAIVSATTASDLSQKDSGRARGLGRCNLSYFSENRFRT